jgi:hypothetical protein
MMPIAKLPEYLQKTGYKNPSASDPLGGPAQYGLEIGGNVFEYVVSNPKLLDAFNAFFEGDRGSRPSWVDWYPIQEKLLSDPSKTVTEEDILYVDVAGGRGHDLLEFKRKFPEQKGRYLLYDQAHVIADETLELGPGVEKKAFDFFEEGVAPGNLFNTCSLMKTSLTSTQAPVSTI